MVDGAATRRGGGRGGGGGGGGGDTGGSINSAAGRARYVSSLFSFNTSREPRA